jgi:hypothetical protein
MMGKKLKTVCACLLFAAALPLTAQDIFWTREIDWEKGELTLTLSAPLDQSGPNRPTAAITAERRIDTNLARIFSEALLPLQVDSARTFADAVEEGEFPVAQLLSLALTGRKGIPRYSRDMRSISVTYAYALHDLLADYFVRHRRPREIPRYIAWLPTREYTGIVIYTGKELPVHGEDASSSAVPCLFPEIFDEEANPLLTLDRGSPEWLKRWGSAAYTRSFDETPWRQRIGERPLYLIARGLYGKYPTDIKISAEDAARILARPGGRALLAEGRVLIILGGE